MLEVSIKRRKRVSCHRYRATTLQDAVCKINTNPPSLSPAGVVVDSSVAKRFIRNALWEGDEKESNDKIQEGRRKKMKLEDNEAPK